MIVCGVGGTVPVKRKYDSFAIGVVNDSETSVSIDLSINIWADLKRSSEIDFGIQIPNVEHISGFFIFVPFDLSETDVVDLSKSFRDGGFNQLLFNSDVKTTSHLDRTVITDTYGRTSLVLPFSPFEGMVISHLEDGTMFSVHYSPSEFPREYDSLYFRLRIPFALLNGLLSGPTDMREIISGPIIPFRTFYSIEVNQVRGLPDSISRLIVESKTDIKQIHIAVIASRQWELISPLTPYRVRSLENNAWEGYQPLLKKDHVRFRSRIYDMFVYQWLLSGCNDSLRLEFSRKRITLFTVVTYLLILLLINLFSEAVIRYLFE